MDEGTMFSKLHALLDEGETVFVVSEYGSSGCSVHECVCRGDEEGYARVEALQHDPHAVHAGPLTSVRNDDGSLILVERFMAKPRLVILGGGHIALALSSIAHLTDFDTLIYDDRPGFANTQRFPTARQVFCDSFSNLARHITFGPSDFVVDVTRGHLHDKECLEVILAGPEPAYTGMIGSRRRVAIVMSQLEDEGFDAQRIARVHAPIGLKIGAQTPSEIAISIMAQIIEVKRGMQQDRAPWLSGDLELVECIARAGFCPEAVITVLATEGSVPTEAGCKLGMTYEGSLAGSVGGGCTEAEAIQIGREVIRNGGWKLHIADLTDTAEDEGMVCGGTMQLLIEKV
jgi:xanthine dehydrogenase accessory factor